MDLEGRLVQDKETLAKKWYELVLGTYPPETQKVWKRNKDLFTNPVGGTLQDALARLLDFFIQWRDAEAISHELDRIIKIRAVQDFAPSQALSFIPMLKKMVRERYLAEILNSGTYEQIEEFDTKVDNLLLRAFDIYSESRKKIFELRVQEVKKAQHMLLRKANLVVDSPAP